MSLSEEQMMELMAYADGELEGADAARVAAFAAQSADAQRLLADLGVLGTAVRAAEDQRATAASVDGVVDDVMRRLAVIEAPTATVVSISTARRSSGRVWALAAGGLALAAGLALLLRGSNVDDLSGKPGPGGATVLASAGAPEEDPSGVEIENVESTDNAVSVFYLPAAAAGANLTASSVVVWITDDPPPSGDL